MQKAININFDEVTVGLSLFLKPFKLPRFQ